VTKLRMQAEISDLRAEDRSAARRAAADRAVSAMEGQGVVTDFFFRVAKEPVVRSDPQDDSGALAAEPDIDSSSDNFIKSDGAASSAGVTALRASWNLTGKFSFSSNNY
jgi:hypothetical protein